MRITSTANTTITDSAPKVIESINGVVLNTQYYTKERLSPIPFETFYTYGSPYSLCTRKQMYLQNFSWNYPNDEIGLLKDSTYSNRYYMRTLDGYISGSRSSRLVTFQETENGEMKAVHTDAPGDYQFMEYVDQDDTRFYYTTRTTTTMYLRYINKQTFAVTDAYKTTSANSYSYLKCIHKDDVYIYFMTFINQQIYALRYNKQKLAMEISSAIYRGQETTTNAYVLSNLSDNEYKVDDNTYGLFLFNIDDLEQPLDLYQYDTSKTLANGFTMRPVTITWGEDITSFNFLKTGTQYNTIRNFISEFNGIKYLHVTLYQMNYNNANYIPYQGIYTFRIESDTELTFTGYNQIDGAKQIGGFIYDESKEHLIVAKQNAFQILKFNQTTLKYESTNYEVSGCYSVGLDELQRVWYIKTDTSVHMVNLEDAQSVEIEFEKEYYEYTGSTISTYINFSALNYLGEDMAGTFELTINGPAIFTENNDTTLRFDYNGQGKEQIGITITGASPVTIYPKFIS